MRDTCQTDLFFILKSWTYALTNLDDCQQCRTPPINIYMILYQHFKKKYLEVIFKNIDN